MNAPPLPNKSLNEEIRKKEQELKEEQSISMGEFNYILFRIQKIIQLHQDMNPERMVAFLIVQNIIYKEILDRQYKLDFDNANFLKGKKD